MAWEGGPSHGQHPALPLFCLLFQGPGSPELQGREGERAADTPAGGSHTTVEAGCPSWTTLGESQDTERQGRVAPTALSLPEYEGMGLSE